MSLELIYVDKSSNILPNLLNKNYMFRIITHSRDQGLQASLLCYKVAPCATVGIGQGMFEISVYVVPLFLISHLLYQPAVLIHLIHCFACEDQHSATINQIQFSIISK